MYDISFKNTRKGNSVYLIFLFVGIVLMIAFGLVIVSSNNKLKSLDSTVISSRVEISTYKSNEGNIMYSPVYYYEVDGTEYSCPSNSSSSSKPKTDNANVYYDSKNPEDCMTDYSKSVTKYMYIGVLVGALLTVVGTMVMIKGEKKIKKIKELNKYGKLVKNLPYRLEPSGITVNNVPVQRPVVDYTLASGVKVTLYGDPRMDRKVADADGKVDLIIDENDPSNYFIDFEINRLTGNLSSDYYKPTTSEQNNNQVNQNNNTNTL